MKWLDETTAVAGQISAEDMPAIKAAGVTMIVNNRPDGEEPGQPRAAEIEVAAEAAGIGYRHVPMSHGLSAELVQAMADALDAAPGPALAFCRSGTRSTYLWALARSLKGDGADDLIGKAANAGYDLTPISRFL